ncbi:hypothetical protein ABPG72_000357 [Tetrahymena utriculariae]
MEQGEENNEQYKEKLFHLFSDTGMLNSVKAQMRHKMIEKLVKSQKVLQVQQKIHDEKNQHKALLMRVMASIVSEYFDKNDYSYSNSIFQPESGYSNKILQRFEILDIMNCKNIDNPKISILETMVETYLNNVKNVPKTNCATQTEHADAIFNLEQRLNTVDHKYREKVQEINTPAHEIEERLQRFKREFENRLKAEMNAEVVRIREFEMAAVRMEEQEKYRKLMSEYREELEKGYMDRLTKLREREKDTLEKCTNKMKEIESINHDHRQRILKDFELLRMREHEIDKQRILNDETLKIQKQKLENLEQELKEKIKKAEEYALIIEKKYQNDLAYTKLEAHRDLEAEKLEIIEKKRILDEDMYKIKQVKETAAQLTDQTKKLSEDNRKLTDELIEVRRQKKEQEFELVQLRDNIRTVSDSYKRDQDSARNLEQKLKIKDEEVNFFKSALEEQKKLVDQYKQSQVDHLKKFNNEIQVYQNQIEVLEEKIKELRKINKENEDLLDEARKQRYEMSYRQPLEFNHYHLNAPASYTTGQGPTSLKPQFQKELDDLREKRRQEILQYQRETEVVEKKNYSFKFENIWDISNASIDFTQFKVHKPSQDRQILEKAELTKSQMYQDFGLDKKAFTGVGGTNIIEESFREELDFAKYEAKLRESYEKIDQNNSSRLRVMSEVERSRKDSFNVNKGKSDEQQNQNFTIKKTTNQSPTKNTVEQQSSQEKIQTKSTFSKQTLNQIGSLQDNPSLEQQLKHKKEDSSSLISKDAMLSIPQTFTQQTDKKQNLKDSPLETKKQTTLQPLADLAKKDQKSSNLNYLPPPFTQKQAPQSDFNYFDDFEDLDDYTHKNKKSPLPLKDDKKDLWSLPKDSDLNKKSVSNPFSKKKEDPFYSKNDDIYGKKFDPFGKKDDKFGSKDDPFTSKKNDFSLPSTQSKQQKFEQIPAPYKQDKSTIDNKDEEKTISEEIEEIVDYNEEIVEDLEYF